MVGCESSEDGGGAHAEPPDPDVLEVDPTSRYIRGNARPSQFGSSPRDWYTGWSCMSSLINKGLVAKWSNPAKYKLTEAGKELALECMKRSNLGDTRTNLANSEGLSELHIDNELDIESTRSDSCREETRSSASLRQKSSVDVPVESLERFMRMGYSKEQVLRAFSEVLKTSHHKELSSLWPAVMCQLREDQVYGGEKPTGNRSDLVDLSLPPLSFGERFEDIYEVILTLDDREQFSNQRKVVRSSMQWATKSAAGMKERQCWTAEEDALL